jgi:hypothetical protein
LLSNPACLDAASSPLSGALAAAGELPSLPPLQGVERTVVIRI